MNEQPRSLIDKDGAEMHATRWRNKFSANILSTTSCMSYSGLIMRID